MVRKTWNQVSKNIIEKWFQKTGFPDTRVESYENDEDISSLEEVTPGIGFNDQITCDDGLSVSAVENEIVDFLEQINKDSDAGINNETCNEIVTFPIPYMA